MVVTVWVDTNYMYHSVKTIQSPANSLNAVTSIKVHTGFTVDFLLEGPIFPLYPYHHLHSCLQLQKKGTWLQKKGTPMNEGYGYE